MAARERKNEKFLKSAERLLYPKKDFATPFAQQHLQLTRINSYNNNNNSNNNPSPNNKEPFAQT